jgi:hypothetical protein
MATEATAYKRHINQLFDIGSPANASEKFAKVYRAAAYSQAIVI